MTQRVAVFIDYQNVYKGARERSHRTRRRTSTVRYTLSESD